MDAMDAELGIRARRPPRPARAALQAVAQSNGKKRVGGVAPKVLLSVACVAGTVLLVLWNAAAGRHDKVLLKPSTCLPRNLNCVYHVDPGIMGRLRESFQAIVGVEKLEQAHQSSTMFNSAPESTSFDESELSSRGETFDLIDRYRQESGLHHYPNIGALTAKGKLLYDSVNEFFSYLLLQYNQPLLMHTLPLAPRFQVPGSTATPIHRDDLPVSFKLMLAFTDHPWLLAAHHPDSEGPVENIALLKDQAFVFQPASKHGSLINKSDRSRVSIDMHTMMAPHIIEYLSFRLKYLADSFKDNEVDIKLEDAIAGVETLINMGGYHVILSPEFGGRIDDALSLFQQALDSQDGVDAAADSQVKWWWPKVGEKHKVTFDKLRLALLDLKRVWRLDLNESLRHAGLQACKRRAELHVLELNHKVNCFFIQRVDSALS